MAFNSTLSSSSANSYVSVAEADDYFSLRFSSALWSISTAIKQQLLVTATKRLENELFQGVKTIPTQSLKFPRVGISDSDGYVINPSTMPIIMLEATCEMAYSYLEEKQFTTEQLQNLVSYSASLGSLSESYSLKNTVVTDIPFRVQTILASMRFYISASRKTTSILR